MGSEWTLPSFAGFLHGADLAPTTLQTATWAADVTPDPGAGRRIVIVSFIVQSQSGNRFWELYDQSGGNLISTGRTSVAAAYETGAYYDCFLRGAENEPLHCTIPAGTGTEIFKFSIFKAFYELV